MGFFDVIDGALNLLSKFVNASANRIDKMSDDEIENTYSKPAAEMRNVAETAHLLYERRQTQQNDDD